MRKPWSQQMNKTSRIVACALLCIPFVAAVVVGFKTDKGSGSNIGGKAADKTLTKISVTSANGSSFDFTDEETLRIYSDILGKAKKIDTPQPDDASALFDVDFVTNEDSSKYRFIMTGKNPANCLFEDINGDSYLIDSDSAFSLLLRNEFSAAYAGDGVPTASYSDGNAASEFLPAVYDWNYKKVNNENAHLVANGENAVPVTLKLPENSNFSVAFSKAPDLVTLNASLANQQIYSGTPDGLSTVTTFDADTVLNVVMDATWYESDASGSYGTAKYVFDVYYDIPAVCSLVDKQLKPGEFTLIKILNGNPDEQITVSAPFMPDGGSSVNYALGDARYIYVPIKVDAEAGQQTITVNTESGSQTMDFTVLGANLPSYEAAYPAGVIELNTEESRTEYENIITTAQSTSSERQLWNGKFKYPAAGTNLNVFGGILNVAGFESSRINGVYISAVNGSSVYAANSGIVVYAGESKYGGFSVIVDHGLGVFSQYRNLGSVSCSVGDNVDTSTAIGTVGTSGVTPYSDAVFYTNVIGGSYVNPVSQVLYGISFG